MRKGFHAVQPNAAMPGVGQDLTSVFTFLKAVEEAKIMNVKQLVQATKDHNLVQEHIPTNHLNFLEVSHCSICTKARACLECKVINMAFSLQKIFFI